jgi:hypothetical protein
VKTYVLDTHALVWRLTNDRWLGAQDATRERVLTVIEADGRCVIRPIDLEIIRAMPMELDIHDALIVGAALTHVTPVDSVLTCDQDIIRAGLVPVIW